MLARLHLNQTNGAKSLTSKQAVGAIGGEPVKTALGRTQEELDYPTTIVTKERTCTLTPMKEFFTGLRQINNSCIL